MRRRCDLDETFSGAQAAAAALASVIARRESTHFANHREKASLGWSAEGLPRALPVRAAPTCCDATACGGSSDEGRSRLAAQQYQLRDRVASSVEATASNSASAAVSSSTISRATTSGAGRLSASSRDSSRSQVMSRLTLSRATSSSYEN